MVGVDRSLVEVLGLRWQIMAVLATRRLRCLHVIRVLERVQGLEFRLLDFLGGSLDDLKFNLRDLGLRA